MAAPTAYTGASGAIIVAMGGVVYTEYVAGPPQPCNRRRHSNDRQPWCCAAPLLWLVLIIAVLETRSHYRHSVPCGARAYSLMTFGDIPDVALITRDGSIKVASAKEALVPSLKAFIPLCTMPPSLWQRSISSVLS